MHLFQWRRHLRLTQNRHIFAIMLTEERNQIFGATEVNNLPSPQQNLQNVVAFDPASPNKQRPNREDGFI
jgi:hypothetical protein